MLRTMRLLSQKEQGQVPISYFPPHHLLCVLRHSKVKSSLGIQIRGKMGMTFLIFITEEQNLSVLDTRSFISSKTVVNTESKKLKNVTLFGMFGGPHQPESLAVRDSIAKAQIKDSRLYLDL